jgi:transposase
MNNQDNQYLQLKETKLLEIIGGKKNITQVCKELDVSRPTVYEWLSRYKRFGISGLVHRKKLHRGSPVNKTSIDKEKIVVQLARKYFTDGVETLHDRLEYEHGISLHPVTIFRILKRTNTRYKDNYTLTQRNWKKKLYAHQVVGQEVQIDTSYPFGYGQNKVIYSAIDDASRWVFSYTYPVANALNTVDFLEKLIGRSTFKIHKIRTDQGKEFIAKIVKKFLVDNNIEHRCNTPYSPEENGKIERFHKTLKSKCLPYGFAPDQTLDTFQYRLTLFLHYYNYIKKHKGLGLDGQTPFQRIQELDSSSKG